ncbi:glutamate-1-semialdehyde aminotransferase [Reinekea forsetii]|uniref:Glutamate-1-semialdehyde aminotransferase n=2 Tax=Reinekea forsetii TaxID=1336806 RepID=A0A2K8KP99_9GAMM|nr:glutamate-1-semialdehyde aminotransferase [Reinekea forsetii]
MGSSRLPGKVLKLINGIPVIELLLFRLSQSKLVDQIVVATSDADADIRLADYVRNLGFSCSQGSENDVLERFYNAAKEHDADIVVRITGDCPLVDADLVDQVIKGYLSSDVDYFSNGMPPTYPDGLDVEVFSFSVLEQSHFKSQEPHEREHVTPYARDSGFFKTGNMESVEDFSNIRLTLDEHDDLILIDNIFNYFSPEIHFTWSEILTLREQMPNIFEINKHIDRNEGASMGAGQKLYKRAKHVIPGGNMLLSKRPEMFLPDQWPAYFSKAKGCKVWDLDGTELIDMSIMGIGTNILGYGHQEVDDAVLKCVKDGNMSTLNCPEEVYLAEKLIEINPWADMVRFARAGGEINSIAIRIARAHTGRDKVAICGYHGWHDWYLASNLNSDQSLDGHLLPGLQPLGVPRGLTGTVLPFSYNNIEELENLIKENNGEIAAIKMEVSRNSGPIDDYLEKVRSLATENKIVLIFDECTSGFRETFGGLHNKFNVEPDIALFAKALGNGYAISACVGRQKIMQAAQNTFISSTFWTERIGPSAALKTLEVMERVKSWKTITQTGLQIRKRWQLLADNHDLGISHWGLPSLTGYTFQSENALAYKTLVTQEMLAKGYLASNSVYVSTEHTPTIIDGYFDALQSVFGLIKECEEGRNVSELLKGPICHAGFKRLN